MVGVSGISPPDAGLSTGWAVVTGIGGVVPGCAGVVVVIGIGGVAKFIQIIFCF